MSSATKGTRAKYGRLQRLQVELSARSRIAATTTPIRRRKSATKAPPTAATAKPAVTTASLVPSAAMASRTAPKTCDLGAGKNVGGYGGCKANCTQDIRCGDGVKNGTEQCDDGKNVGGYGKCAPGCVFGPRCGDGIKNGTEQCDDGTNDGSYGKCAKDCRYGPRCGDGVHARSRKPATMARKTARATSLDRAARPSSRAELQRRRPLRWAATAACNALQHSSSALRDPRAARATVARSRCCSTPLGMGLADAQRCSTAPLEPAPLSPAAATTPPSGRSKHRPDAAFRLGVAAAAASACWCSGVDTQRCLLPDPSLRTILTGLRGRWASQQRQRGLAEEGFESDASVD